MAAKERPILFSAPMVRAIIAGTKTQTRRIVKPQPELAQLLTASGWSAWHNEKGQPLKNRYGRPGDRLYVRETWMENPDVDAGNGHGAPLYRETCLNHPDERWRPSIHMPRWASRIDLEITGVRVERLNDISEADAQAEGCPCYVCGGAMDGRSEKDCHCFHAKAKPSDFRALWESINGAGSWGANPWVWVVEFARVAP